MTMTFPDSAMHSSLRCKSWRCLELELSKTQWRTIQKGSLRRTGQPVRNAERSKPMGRAALFGTQGEKSGFGSYFSKRLPEKTTSAESVHPMSAAFRCFVFAWGRSEVKGGRAKGNAEDKKSLNIFAIYDGNRFRVTLSFDFSKILQVSSGKCLITHVTHRQASIDW